jgi:hypothetical protein
MADEAHNSFRVDKQDLTDARQTAPVNQIAYWHAQTVDARLEAIERMRRIKYGDAALGRIQRVLEVVDMKTGQVWRLL